MWLGAIVDAVIDWFLAWRFWLRDEPLKGDESAPVVTRKKKGKKR